MNCFLGISSGNGSYQDTVVSSLIGTESVEINAGGKLRLAGSIIAHITNDGKDGGNLNVKAGSIEVTHLEDHNTNRQSGFNAGINVGGLANDGAYPSGSTSIGLNRSGHEKEGMTYATIGSGNIAVADGGSLSELNRDIDNIKVTTKDVITGALDVNLSVDNRLFTQSGRDSIATDFTDIGENAVLVAKKVWISPNNIVGAIWAETALLLGVKYEYDNEKDIHNVLEHPLMPKGTAITLGETIHYGEGADPMKIYYRMKPDIKLIKLKVDLIKLY